MSRETLQGIEDALTAHYRSVTEDDGDAEGSVITGWIVGYEHSNLMDVDGESVVAYTNDYATSVAGGPNFARGLAAWTHDVIIEDTTSMPENDD